MKHCSCLIKAYGVYNFIPSSISVSGRCGCSTFFNRLIPYRKENIGNGKYWDECEYYFHTNNLSCLKKERTSYTSLVIWYKRMCVSLKEVKHVSDLIDTSHYIMRKLAFYFKTIFTALLSHHVPLSICLIYSDWLAFINIMEGISFGIYVL